MPYQQETRSIRAHGLCQCLLLWKHNSSSLGARPVHLIITIVTWIRTSRLSRTNYVSAFYHTTPSTGPHIQELNVQVQGYFDHKKHPPSIGPSQGPRHSPTAGSEEGAVFDERGAPVCPGDETCSVSRIKVHSRCMHDEDTGCAPAIMPISDWVYVSYRHAGTPIASLLTHGACSMPCHLLRRGTAGRVVLV